MNDPTSTSTSTSTSSASAAQAPSAPPVSESRSAVVRNALRASTALIDDLIDLVVGYDKRQSLVLSGATWMVVPSSESLKRLSSPGVHFVSFWFKIETPVTQAGVVGTFLSKVGVFL